MDYEQAITMFTIQEGKKIWGFFKKDKLMEKGTIYMPECMLNNVHSEVTSSGADTHMEQGCRV
jgi:hypothetical protein